MAISARAAELRAAGAEVISLAAGEPDFETPAPIAEAGIAAIRAGDTHYTAADGTAALRGAIAKAMARDHGLEYRASEVCVTAGTKSAIALCLLALVEEGDEVIVPAPYWVSYPPLVEMAGGVPRVVETTEDNGFVPTLAQLERTLAEPRVRGILVNSPSNPSGQVWPEERVHALVELCRKHDRWIVSDEIYTRIRYGETRPISPAECPGGRECTAVLNGLSKAFAMTGWRLGWVAGPSKMISAVKSVQSHTIGNPCTISQAAALAALSDEGNALVQVMVDAFRERCDWFVPALQALPGITLRPPEGAFYVFPGVAALCEAHGTDDIGLCKMLLDELQIATVPGTAFGTPGHVRLSFAASLDNLRTAVERLHAWLKR
jgi:aspartate aminotransferase